MSTCVAGDNNSYNIAVNGPASEFNRVWSGGRIKTRRNDRRRRSSASANAARFSAIVMLSLIPPQAK
jgi:hypothetical protein